MDAVLGAACGRVVGAFWLQPIIPDPSNFDSPDERQNFTGLWTTYRSKPGRFWDIYALNLENSNPVAVGESGVRGGTNVTTLGTRIIGDIDNTWLYDFEGMFQVGRYAAFEYLFDICFSRHTIRCAH